MATRIDCDIHPSVGGTRTTLLPYLSEHWQEQVVSRAIDGLDLNSYPPNMPFSGRADWRPATDQEPATAAATRKRLLDKLATDGNRIIGYHLPVPGLGRVERKGAAYAFAPLA